ncbi:uncharacterized protein BJ171DRAFT_433867, partial [Polychytrium aggregatum]|uniref:uncharacterized protein n=1 Tax=Polychytrium aggregatum TaxID=110093 RepID=UPI0022FEF4BB
MSKTIVSSSTLTSELAEFLSSFVYSMWHSLPLQTAVVSLKTGPSTFSHFCESLLKNTGLSFSVVLVALKLIHRLKQNRPDLTGVEGSECRLLVCALMLSMKVLMDNTYTNRTWVKVSKIPLKEINIMEMELLVQLHFDLFVSEYEYLVWI